MSFEFGVAGWIFVAAVGLTFGAALVGRVRARAETSDEDLAGRSLNRWIIGLSAGTAANSGFIVTGAVGLGYSGGVQWILLPLSWLLGDLVFWSLFPDRLNRMSRAAHATTLSELLTFNISGKWAAAIAILVSILLVVFLSTYTAAQWLAGRKFLAGVFQLSDLSALLLFALTIVGYSSLGGFRGSVYTDLIQALIRIIGTIVALVAVTAFALSNRQAFSSNLASAGDGFLYLLPNGTLLGFIGFVLGYAAAAIGFGLGQPQIVSRYFAGSSPQETKAARWVYIGFVQFTWIAMTLFGVLLRGVMPGISDPETGLSVFFQQHVTAVATGIIFADVYATVASTSNGILVATSQTFLRDVLFRRRKPHEITHTGMTIATLLLGGISILLSLVLPGNVFSIAIGSVSKIGAGVAGPVMIKILSWRHSGPSLLVAILSGIVTAFVWSYLGYDSSLNAALVGIAASLVANWIAFYLIAGVDAASLYKRSSASDDSQQASRIVGPR